MKIFLLLWVVFASIALGADTTSLSSSITTTTTSTASPTSVWVTSVINGALTTFQVPYTQSFKTPITISVSVPSGAVGMGSLSGEVGKIRTYSTVTNGGVSIKSKRIVGGNTSINYRLWLMVFSILALTVIVV